MQPGRIHRSNSAIFSLNLFVSIVAPITIHFYFQTLPRNQQATVPTLSSSKDPTKMNTWQCNRTTTLQSFRNLVPSFQSTSTSSLRACARMGSTVYSIWQTAQQRAAKQAPVWRQYGSGKSTESIIYTYAQISEEKYFNIISQSRVLKSERKSAFESLRICSGNITSLASVWIVCSFGLKSTHRRRLYLTSLCTLEMSTLCKRVLWQIWKWRVIINNNN